MTRASAPAEVGAKGFDTVVTLGQTEAAALAAAGFRFGVRYLGSLTMSEVDRMHAAGLAVMPVTYGGAFDGPRAVANAKLAGIPAGATVWLDLEGQDERNGVAALIAKINMWASAVRAAGFDPGLYVGAGSLLTSTELYALGVDRYWHSLSRVTDRDGTLAEPPCGWSMHQIYPGNIFRGGVQVDVDFVQSDYRGRVPSWVTGS